MSKIFDIELSHVKPSSHFHYFYFLLLLGWELGAALKIDPLVGEADRPIWIVQLFAFFFVSPVSSCFPAVKKRKLYRYCVTITRVPNCIVVSPFSIQRYTHLYSTMKLNVSSRGVLGFFSCFAIATVVDGAPQDPRNIAIHNDSGSKVEVYWIHPFTKETVLQSTPYIYNGATFSLNSFVSHAFEAREMPGRSGKCAGDDNTCRVGYFAVNENDEQSK